LAAIPNKVVLDRLVVIFEQKFGQSSVIQDMRSKKVDPCLVLLFCGTQPELDTDRESFSATFLKLGAAVNFWQIV
jgi:hypothetical protein